MEKEQYTEWMRPGKSIETQDGYIPYIEWCAMELIRTKSNFTEIVLKKNMIAIFGINRDVILEGGINEKKENSHA